MRNQREESNALLDESHGLSGAVKHQPSGGAQWGFPAGVKLLLFGGVIQTFSLSDLWVGSFFFRVAGYLSHLMERLL